MLPSRPAGVPFDWVAADTIYGVGAIEMQLRRAGKGYVLGAHATDQFYSWIDKPEVAGTAEQTIAINLLGPIRLTAALLQSLLGRPHAAILNVTSGLAFMPSALTPTYCASKAALHFASRLEQ